MVSTPTRNSRPPRTLRLRRLERRARAGDALAGPDAPREPREAEAVDPIRHVAAVDDRGVNAERAAQRVRPAGAQQLVQLAPGQIVVGRCPRRHDAPGRRRRCRGAQPMRVHSRRSSCTSTPAVRYSTSTGIASRLNGSTRPARSSSSTSSAASAQRSARMVLTKTRSSVAVVLGGEELGGQLAPGGVRQRADQRVDPEPGVPLDVRRRGPPAAGRHHRRLVPLGDQLLAVRAAVGRVLRAARRPFDVRATGSRRRRRTRDTAPRRCACREAA